MSACISHTFREIAKSSIKNLRSCSADGRASVRLTICHRSFSLAHRVIRRRRKYRVRLCRRQRKPLFRPRATEARDDAQKLSTLFLSLFLVAARQKEKSEKSLSDNAWKKISYYECRGCKQSRPVARQRRLFFQTFALYYLPGYHSNAP